MTTTAGAPAHLYERDTIPAYARVIGAAAKVPEAQAVPTIIDQRFPIDNVVVFADTASVQPAALPGGALPPKPAVQAKVVDWEPGRMRITLDGAAPATTYLLVSETWYPDWHATVDGKATPRASRRLRGHRRRAARRREGSGALVRLARIPDGEARHLARDAAHARPVGFAPLVAQELPPCLSVPSSSSRRTTSGSTCP
jgi:hypothetical protein